MNAARAVRDAALPLSGDDADYDALLERTADRPFVLLGEATHGTLEFYRMRAQITRRLIRDQGFEAVAVEADWPDAARVNRFIRGAAGDDPCTALMDFERFPRWMWRNRQALDLVRWLRAHNADRPPEARVGFYGLDLYSLYRSADAVIHYLEEADPPQADVARQRYACLDHVRDPQTYGYETVFRLRPSCEQEVVEQLLELRYTAPADDPMAIDPAFQAQGNAVVVQNAEAYYRSMFGSNIDSWNLRDSHMADTLLALRERLRERGGEGRIVVWAHNSHIGDARATRMGDMGEWNLGQLVRRRAGADNALLVGFTTYTGHVAAADNWDGDVRRKRVRPALPGSCEALFHEAGLDAFFLPLDEPPDPLWQTMLERAIGVIYRPETERASHYFEANLPRQFDALFHIDKTEAVQPLDVPAHWHPRHVPEDAPETYPFGV